MRLSLVRPPAALDAIDVERRLARYAGAHPDPRSQAHIAPATTLALSLARPPRVWDPAMSRQTYSDEYDPRTEACLKERPIG